MDAAADAAAPSAVAEASQAKSDAADEQDVKPVYPVEGVIPDPVAKRLCEALHDVPEARRAECCDRPKAAVLTGECVRMLSAAMKAKAVHLDAASAEACALAIDRTHAGCEWVGPFPPDPPTACLGILRGSLAAGQRCRSSLECAEGLRCHGVGPTTTGVCGPARDDGAACAGSADPLAGFARQGDLDVTHPECKGYCSRFKCASFTAEGGACAQSRECGPGRQCVEGDGAAKTRPATTAPGLKGGRCVTRAASRLGEPCPGGVCESGALCVAGRCSLRKAAGASCQSDFECVGGCVRSDGSTKGTCSRKCDAR